MSKDESIPSAMVFVACIALGYAVFLFAQQPLIALAGITLPLETVQFWLVAIFVLIAFVAITFIGA